MKNTIRLSLLGILFATTSCNDFLDVNKDPNRVTDDNITAELIFTQVENAVGVRQAQRFEFLNNWMGYWSRSGSFIVEQEETTYKITNTFGETNWDNAYNILFDLNQVSKKALADGDKFLAGTSIVLSAKLWQETVDMWGAIPYSQAFNYEKYPRPAYDNAADIYADLLVKLDTAISYLNETPKKTFAKTDIIYCRGAESKLATVADYWKKFANTIKLRIYIRKSEKGVAPSATEIAKMTADGGFIGQGDDVNVNPGYSNQTDRQNPFYADFGLTPSGAAASTNNKANNYFKGLLTGDPRLTEFYKAPITGTDYGALNGNKKPGGDQIPGTDLGPGLAGSAEQDQWIFPAFESLFLQAEATLRGWLPGGDSQAQNLLESAVTESFKWLKVADAETEANAYITDKVTWPTSGTTDDKLALIIYQKYTSLNGIDPLEAWSDLRRLGRLNYLPAGYLSWNPQRAASLPNVITYPQTEFTTNSVSVPKPTRTTETIFTEKLFWQP